MASTNIEMYLAKILAAVRGKDVRQSIHDAIKELYGLIAILNPDEINTLNKLKTLDLKDGIHIYPSKVSQYGITISGASLRQNTRYRLEYKDVYESGILIKNVKYLWPNDGMDLEWPAELIDGCYEFTTGNKVCKEIYIDLSGDSWDGTYETAVALMDGIFLFNAEAMELSNSLDELATIFSSAVAKDGVPLIYYTHAEDSITTISVLLKANTKYAVEYNSLLTPDISVDAVRLFDLVEASTTEIKGADNVFTFETGSNNRLMLDLVVSGDGWDASKDTALQVIGGITVCRADGTTVEEMKLSLNKLLTEQYHPDLYDGEIDSSGELIESNAYYTTTEFMLLMPESEIIAVDDVVEVHSYDIAAKTYIEQVAFLEAGVVYKVADEPMLLRAVLHTNADIKIKLQFNNVIDRLNDVEKSIAEKIDLPKDKDGNVQNGTIGQFAVSDGKGGITWLTVKDGNEVAY